MTLRSKVASALSFAHFAGLAKAGASEDDDKDRHECADEDDPEKKDQDRENIDSKKSKKAEDDKEKESAEGDDPEKEDDDENKEKGKAKADDEEPDAEDDDDEEEMRGASAAAKARRRERARCASIFASKAAARNPVLAANLAFNTSMTRKEALAVLENTPAAVAAGTDRAARNPALGAGGSIQRNSKQAVASGWDAAFSKVAPRR